MKISMMFMLGLIALVGCRGTSPSESVALSGQVTTSQTPIADPAATAAVISLLYGK